MRYAKIVIALATLTSSVNADDQSACSGLPVVTSEAAICRVDLHLLAQGTGKIPATSEAEEHEGHWLVLLIPASSTARAGGARFKVDKATGNVELVELVEFIKAPQAKAMPNTSLERTRER